MTPHKLFELAWTGTPGERPRLALLSSLCYVPGGTYPPKTPRPKQHPRLISDIGLEYGTTWVSSRLYMRRGGVLLGGGVKRLK